MRRFARLLAFIAVVMPAGESEAAKEKFDRSKPHVNIGTIGHVDHGKNTLTAAIVNVLRAEGAPAFPPLPQNVRGSDKGAHGIVMHSCDVEYETAERIYRHIDCGGSENFIRDWIMGQPVIEAAVLVVDATDGPTPQTREHVLLARQTGVPIPVVFMNKADLVDDPVLLERVEEEVCELLSEYMFPCDPPFVRGNIEGALLGEPPHVAATKQLVDNLDIFIVPAVNPADKPFLMAVEDVFTIRGRGTVATGRVERGTVMEGDIVEIVGLAPTRTTAEVAGLERVAHSLDEGLPGDEVGLLLRGVDKDEVQRGQVLAAPGSVMPHKTFGAEIYVLDRNDGGGNRAPFFSGYRPQFYFRTADVTGTIYVMPARTMIAPGSHGTVMVELDEEIGLEEGQRFEIRDGRRRVGAGVVAPARVR